nr:MAG TPA: hypothetical protein [Caudoviricetes sp.]
MKYCKPLHCYASTLLNRPHLQTAKNFRLPCSY